MITRIVSFYKEKGGAVQCEAMVGIGFAFIWCQDLRGEAVILSRENQRTRDCALNIGE